MTTQTESLPIVGARYRPPADAILRILPYGHPLSLIAEPTNLADPNAIRVDAEVLELPREAFDLLQDVFAALAEHGLPVAKHIALGYLPAAVAAHLTQNGFPLTRVPATFILSPTGKPHVKFDRMEDED